MATGYCSLCQRERTFVNKVFEQVELFACPVCDTHFRMCPECGTPYTGFPATSRRDNSTEICPDCGLQQARAAVSRFQLGGNPHDWGKQHHPVIFTPRRRPRPMQ